ncbi:hypothetical protein, partial [Brevibacterium aurantiacum]
QSNRYLPQVRSYSVGAAGASHESMKFRENFGPAGRMSAIMSIGYTPLTFEISAGRMLSNGLRFQ